MAVFVLACSTAGAAGADGLREMSRADQRIFHNYSRVFCRQFFTYEDDFVILPNYVRDREASTGKTYDQAEEELTETRIERVSAGMTREVKVLPERTEVIAASMILPNIDVGHYGFIDQVRVAEIVSENEMIISHVRLIDPQIVGAENNARNLHRRALRDAQRGFANKAYRLHGFSTEGLVVGQTYRGPQERGIHVAIVGSDRRHNFVMVNFDRLQRTRVAQFADVVEYADISPSDFNTLMRTNREEHGARGDRETLIHLYRLYYTRFRVRRPAQVSPEPATRNTPEPEPVPPKPKPVELEPTTQPEPGTEVEPTPEPEPEPDVTPEPEPEPDDRWEDEEDDYTPPPPPDEPGFFGIPLE